MKTYQNELNSALKAARSASFIIQKIYQQNDIVVEIKNDDSPVTIADKEANEEIQRILKADFPHYSILSEESEDDLSRLKNDYVWIIDPLDGTKDFIAKTGEFSVNIALSYRGNIVVGVIAIPAHNEYYYATITQGSFRIIHDVVIQNHVSNHFEKLIVLQSHFHRKPQEDLFLNQLSGFSIEKKACGSSYKACLIASGKADYAFKMGEGTKEWDIAASDIIVTEAGGFFANAFGKKFTYNRRDCYNHEGFVIMGVFNPKLLISK